MIRPSASCRCRASIVFSLVAALLVACAPAAPPAAPKAEAPSGAASAPKPAEQKPAATAAPAKPAEQKPAATTAPAAQQTAQAQAQTDGPEPRRGGTLRFGISSEWKTLDPPLYTGVSERMIFYSIYNPLVAMDENLNIVPELARSWQVSPDGLEWTFSLASGVKFHDGTPFNAEAAKFNLDRLMS